MKSSIKIVGKSIDFIFPILNIIIKNLRIIETNRKEKSSIYTFSLEEKIPFLKDGD